MFLALLGTNSLEMQRCEARVEVETQSLSRRANVVRLETNFTNYNIYDESTRTKSLS